MRLRVALGAPDEGRALRQVVVDGVARPVREVRRDVTLRTTIVNPLAAGDFDRYITGNCLVGPGQGCFEGVEGDHRAWLSVWLGERDVVRAVRDADGFPSVRSGTFHGVAVIDGLLEVPSLSEAWLEVESSGTGVVELLPDGTLRYRLGWWRQAKAVPDLLDVEIVAPPGWRVASVSVEGAQGRVPLLGPGATSHREGLTVGRRGDGVVVSGQVGSDLTLEVVLRQD